MEFLALRLESDEGLLRQGLGSLALRLLDQGRNSLALACLETLDLSPNRHRGEFLLRHFLREAVDPISIAGIAVGGAVFQSVKLASLSRLWSASKASLWTRGWGAGLLAGTLGYLAEVPAFTLTHAGLSRWSAGESSGAPPSFLQKLAGNALFLGALKLSGGLGQQSLPWFGNKIGPKTAQALIPLAAQAGGLLVSRKVEERVGWRKTQTTGLDIADITSTLLQFHIAGALQKTLWGNSWHTLEAQAFALDPARAFSPKRFSAATQNRFDSGDGRRIFPQRLVNAISAASNDGGKAQWIALEALDRLYKYDAASYSTASLQNALWLNFFHQAVQDPNEIQGHMALLSALAVMANNPSRSSLLKLAQDFGYAKPWRVSVPEYAAAESEIRALPEYNRYSAAEIGIAMQIARSSPYGKILLRRLRNILVEGDIPGKLRELWKEESFDTASTLTRLRQLGLLGEALASSINNTAHTAYLDDLRVARKVVSVYEEITPFLVSPQLREVNLKRIQGDYMDIWLKYPALGADAMLAFLERQSDPQANALLRAVQQGKLEMEMVSPNAFDEYVRRNGVPENCSLSLFLKPRNAKLPSLLWLRAMPEETSFDDPQSAFSEFGSRAVAAFHEWEHYRHFHGEFDPREAKSHPFNIQTMSREDRLASETMAILEQLRWGIKHLDDEYYQVARQMGENLPQFARNMADWGYFGKGR